MKDEKIQIKQEKIIELTSSWCDEKVNDDYKELSTKLVEKLGGEVVGSVFLIELAGLEGRKKLDGYRVDAVITYEGK